MAFAAHNKAMPAHQDQADPAFANQLCVTPNAPHLLPARQQYLSLQPQALSARKAA